MCTKTGAKFGTKDSLYKHFRNSHNGEIILTKEKLLIFKNFLKEHDLEYKLHDDEQCFRCFAKVPNFSKKSHEISCRRYVNIMEAISSRHYDCAVCTYSTKNRLLAIKHYQNYHPEKVLKFETMNERNQDVQNRNEYKFPKCNFCDETLDGNGKYHLNECRQFLNFTINGTKCKICQQDFKNLRDLFLHITENHDVKSKSLCGFCGQQVPDSDFEEHTIKCIDKTAIKTEPKTFDYESESDQEEQNLPQNFEVKKEKNEHNQYDNMKMDIKSELKIKTESDLFEINCLEICPLCNGKFISAEKHLIGHHRFSEEGVNNLKKKNPIEVINLDDL